ncbi:MAG: hypothetical protein RMI89_03925 [Gloeomargarita sp. SKYBB_i_bin120]|nr:hypothetical protein [Gloeomargarita sp. SKYG98]MCS7292106.1 hypothetical protein [Gloeomargarita sp. SKYB120]MDW8177666.1 hypothetical protein [Gloeomargarita sp. SKYBB_i_bin120]
MRCINCGTNNNLRDRQANQGRCKQCGTPFAFEPTDMPLNFRLTDLAFQRVIGKLSANGALCFTKKQLYYELCRLKERRDKVPEFLFVIVWIISFFILLGPLLIILSVIAFLGHFNFDFLVYAIYPVYAASHFIGLWFASQDLKHSRRDRLAYAYCLIALGFILLISGGANMQQWFLMVVLMIFGVGAISLGSWQARRIPNTPEAPPSLTQELFNSLIDRWTRAHGPLDKLLPRATKNDFATALPAADVTNYSFDRLIVCQSDDIAKMLLANNFHFEYNSGVVSIKGYPSSIFDTVMTMAKRNPDLKVFVLHDCSPEGIRTVHRVKQNPRWFGQQNVTVIDAGISPRQVLSARRPIFCLSSDEMQRDFLTLAKEIRDTLTPAEQRWLYAGNYIPLEFFRPEQIINLLSRSIQLTLQVSRVEEDEPLIALGDSGIYVVDTFG